MGNFKISIKSVDLETINTFNIWGEIYVDINGKSLPDNTWYDSVSSLVHMWLGETIRYCSGQQTYWELPFMDGPYKVCLSECANESVLVSFVANHSEERDHTVVKKGDVLKELLNCAEVFKNLCYRDVPNVAEMRVFLEIQEMYKALREINNSTG